MSFREKGESPRNTLADHDLSASGRQLRVAGGWGKPGKATREKASAAMERSPSIPMR
jgi:hypothetical protein